MNKKIEESFIDKFLESYTDIISEGNFIILLGVKHSGKSTVSKLLAKKLNGYSIDIDNLIEEKEKMSIRQVYNLRGKEGFMSAETSACDYLRDIIFQKAKEKSFGKNKTIVATGGGICDNVAAMEILQDLCVQKKGLMVFLDVSEDVVVNRIIQNSQIQGSYPPYIAKENPKNHDDVRRIFHKFYVERRIKYQALADLTWIL